MSGSLLSDAAQELDGALRWLRGWLGARPESAAPLQVVTEAQLALDRMKGSEIAQLLRIRHAADVLVTIVYGLSMNSDADYDKALGDLREALGDD